MSPLPSMPRLPVESHPARPRLLSVAELGRVLEELERVVVELEESLAELALAYDAGSRQCAAAVIAAARNGA